MHTYDITYRVRGALNGFADHDELVWNVDGVDWPVSIARPRATVHAPGAIIRTSAVPTGPLRLDAPVRVRAVERRRPRRSPPSCSGRTRA